MANTSTHSLSDFKLTRPEKIKWVFPYQGGDVLNYIKSKSTRSFLRSAESELAAAGISYQTRTLTREDFLEWLKLYQTIITQHQYEALATVEWFDKRSAQGQPIEELRFTRDGQVVGSEIFYSNSDRSVACYKVSNHLEHFSNKPNSSLGVLIDYVYVTTAVSRQVQSISFGLSRNAFGVINPLGNLDYKLKFGMVPKLPNNPTFVTDVPLDDSGCVSFLAVSTETEQLGLFSLRPRGTDKRFDLERYNSEVLPYKLLEY